MHFEVSKCLIIIRLIQICTWLVICYNPDLDVILLGSRYVYWIVWISTHKYTVYTHNLCIVLHFLLSSKVMIENSDYDPYEEVQHFPYIVTKLPQVSAQHGRPWSKCQESQLELNSVKYRAAHDPSVFTITMI